MKARNHNNQFVCNSIASVSLPLEGKVARDSETDEVYSI